MQPPRGKVLSRWWPRGGAHGRGDREKGRGGAAGGCGSGTDELVSMTARPRGPTPPAPCLHRCCPWLKTSPQGRARGRFPQNGSKSLKARVSAFWSCPSEFAPSPCHSLCLPFFPVLNRFPPLPPNAQGLPDPSSSVEPAGTEWKETVREAIVLERARQTPRRMGGLRGG